ncbi:ubiquitin-like modifier-activating enzyme 7 isoform 3-T3 [Alca torda]
MATARPPPPPPWLRRPPPGLPGGLGRPGKRSLRPWAPPGGGCSGGRDLPSLDPPMGGAAMAGSEEGLYSRQLYVLGGGARRLAGARVLVSGLRGTGAQVAAALVLTGTGRVVLHDRGTACTADRAQQFLLGESDVGQNRAEVSQRVLAELNPRVEVAAHTGELSEAFLASFQVVVLTESPLEEQLRIGDFCHDRGICFIVADTKGLAGQLFCDFGKQFVVDEPAEGEPVCAVVQDISQGNPGVVTYRGTEDSHGYLFCDGDLVTFSGLEGMTELNDREPIPVRVLDAFKLEIGDTSSFSPYRRGGLVSQVWLPQEHSYEPLRQALVDPKIQVMNPKELPRSRSLHTAFQALHAFQGEWGHLPRPRVSVDAERVLELARSLGAQQGPLDEDVVRAFASVSAGDLCPMAAVVGAMAAQEVLKAITGKFLPLDQWFYFDALECLALEGAERLTEEECAPVRACPGPLPGMGGAAAICSHPAPLSRQRGSRYDGQIAVFGADFQEQLGRQKYFVVGAGAIGCELLKNFAMMGLAAGPGGDLTVTDMDTVALSNLHRQLLYRTADVSKPKAVVAAAAVRRMNPSVRVMAHQNQVGPATELLYGDNFFRRLDGVASALDTLEARAYLERRCFCCHTPLLDSGTEGPRGNVLPMVPSLTEPLRPGDMSRDGTFPLCTLRYFPRTIQHTLQWARDEFEGLFQLPAEHINRFMEDPAFLDQLPAGLEALEVLEQVQGSLRERPRDWQDCVRWARRHWQSCYHDGIAQLLHNYPPEHETSPGVPFWSGDKSCPHPLTFDPDNVSAGGSAGVPCWGQHGQGERKPVPGVQRMPDCSCAPSAAACAGLPGPEQGLALSPGRPGHCWGQLTCALWLEEEERHLHPPRGKVGRLWPRGLMDHPGCPGALCPQDTHLDYILAAAHLFAQMHKVPPCSHRAAVQAILRNVVLPPFMPRDGLQIALTEEQEEAQAPVGEASTLLGPLGHASGSQGLSWWRWGCGAAVLLLPAPAPRRTQTERGGHRAMSPAMPRCRGTTPGLPVPPDSGRLAELTQDLMQQRQELVGGEEVEVPLMEPIHFEKDDNIHVDFITAASNLRAENYGIPLADWLTSKRIAGRIVPAIITTTAAVAGLACLEIYKLVWGCRDLSCYRNNHLWLSDCRLLRMQPLPPPTYQRTHGWTVTMLLHGYTVLYDREGDEETRIRQLAQRLSANLEDAGEPRRRELQLTYVCEGEDAEGEDARPPLLCSLP